MSNEPILLCCNDSLQSLLKVWIIIAIYFSFQFHFQSLVLGTYFSASLESSLELDTDAVTWKLLSDCLLIFFSHCFQQEDGLIVHVL